MSTKHIVTSLSEIHSDLQIEELTKRTQADKINQSLKSNEGIFKSFFLSQNIMLIRNLNF